MSKRMEFYLPFLYFFLIIQKVVASMTGGFLGDMITFVDEILSFIILVCLFLVKGNHSKVILYFILFYLIGFCGSLFTSSPLQSIIIAVFGVVFFLNFPAIFIIFSRFNIFGNRIVLTGIKFLSILILFSVLFQFFFESKFFELRNLVGLKIDENYVSIFIPYPTIFYGLWESAMFNYFLTLFYFLKARNNKKYFFFSIFHFLVCLLSGRLTESVLLIITLLLAVSFRKLLLLVSVVLSLFIFKYSSFEESEASIFLAEGYVEKFIAYQDIDDNVPLRTALMYNAVDQSLLSFPFGVGIGGFSSKASQVFIGNTISNHSKYSYPDISRYNSNILGDNGLAMILGEFGVIGLLMYCIILIVICRRIVFLKIKNFPESDQQSIRLARLILPYFLLAMMKGNYHFYSFFLILFLVPISYSYFLKNDIHT